MADLSSRSDIDMYRLAYYGASWGAAVGPIMVALEERFKTGLFVVGGFWQQEALTECDQINFAPKVEVPVLMLNGRYDSFFPLETSQKPMFRFLGTPEEHKQHVLFESSHAIPRREFIKETLTWLDRYLGPVEAEPTRDDPSAASSL